MSVWNKAEFSGYKSKLEALKAGVQKLSQLETERLTKNLTQLKKALEAKRKSK